MAMLYIENLSDEYRRKLCRRELREDEVASLAAFVSSKFFLHKKGYRLAVILLPTLTVLAAVMSYFSPAARKGNMTVIMWSFAFTLLLEALILVFVYHIAVTRVPRQFADCLKKGYPELCGKYGYERIIDGSLPNDKSN